MRFSVIRGLHWAGGGEIVAGSTQGGVALRLICRRGIAALGVLVVGLVLAPGASASTLDGRARSGDLPLGPLQVSLLRADPGAQRPALVARAVSDRRGRFTLRYEPRKAQAGAVYYLIWKRTGFGEQCVHCGHAYPAHAERCKAAEVEGLVR